MGLGWTHQNGLPPSFAERFAIHERLGQGGTGVVYRAFDRVRRHDVALKRLRVGDGDALYRFKNEFRSLAGLFHPNLVTLYELHSLENEWFFSMELIDGVDWLEHVRPVPDDLGDESPTMTRHATEETADSDPSQRHQASPDKAPRDLRKGALREGLLRDVLAQTAEGILRLHHDGKLHCDLKPSNVLVDRNGRAVVCDFGLVTDAHLGEGERNFAGTPAYMSPEQVLREPLSPATDWYSLGVMLFEALTGARPFVGRSEAALATRSLEDAPRPSTLAPAIAGDLDELCARLLARDPAARAGASEIFRSLGSPRRGPSVVVPAPAEGAFAGRERQLAALRAAYAEMTESRAPVTVFLRGRSGMGKTSLLRRFLAERHASDRATTLRSRCYARESMPYKALDGLVDALGRELMSYPDDTVDALLPGDIAALARLFPTLVRVPAIRRARETYVLADPQARRSRAFQALRQLLANLAARRPTVLAFDDMQWGDLDSAAFLGELIYGADAPPLLVVIAYRSDEAASSPVLQAMTEGGVARNAATPPRYIDVDALSDDEVRELAVSLLPEGAAAARVDAVVREAEGNPLLVTELCRAEGPASSPADGTTRVEDLIAERVAALPADARMLLTIAAVAARPISVELAARIASLKDEARALALLEGQRFIRFRNAGDVRQLEPYHDRVRETITRALPERELRRLHRRLARAFEVHDRRDALALVEHWIGAGEPARATEHALVAARQAEAMLAFERAAHHYQLALQLTELEPAERRTLLTRIGDLLAAAGSLGESAQSYLTAADGAPDEEALDLRRRALEQQLRSGRFAEGLALCRDVLGAIDVKVPGSDRAKLATVAWQRLRLATRGLRFREIPVEQRDPARLRRLDVLWSVSSGLSFVDPLLGTAFQTRQLCEALAAGDPYRASIALTLEVGFRSTAGVRAQRKVERAAGPAMRLAEDSGDPGAQGFAIAMTGLSAFLMGDFARAFDAFSRAEQLFLHASSAFRWQFDATLIFKMAALLYLGRIGELTAMVPRVLRDALARGDEYLALATRGWRSNFAWLALGDPEEARRQANAVVRVEHAGAHFHLQHYYEILALCQIDMYQGDALAAWNRLQQYDRMLTRSMLRRIQSVRVEGRFLRGRTALAVASAGGDRAPYVADARRCAAKIRKDHVRWGDALAALLTASASALEGDAARAIEVYAAAEDLCRASNMELLAHVARLRRGGLQGGDAGTELVRSATAWMRRQTIRDPERIASLFAPG